MIFSPVIRQRETGKRRWHLINDYHYGWCLGYSTNISTIVIVGINKGLRGLLGR